MNNLKITTKIKILFELITAVILTLVVSACTNPPSDYEVSHENTPKPEGGVRVVQVSDIHYYSEKLHDNGERYNTIMSSAGGRDALHIIEITDAFIELMKKEKPDAIIISGDLTLNGEKQSHVDLAEKLSTLEAAGIPVYVIPGNHDINSEYAFEIREDGSKLTEVVTPEEFEQIYSAYGYDEAISRDTGSLSYTVQIGNLYVLMMDTCMYRERHMTAGYMTYDTKLWAYGEIERAKEKGLEVITVTHQNTLSHNAFFDENYCIRNCETFVIKMKELGVKLNLSGHMHCLNIADSEEKYYDIAMSSLAVWPNLYGQLDFKKDGEIEFSTYPVEHGSSSYPYLEASGTKSFRHIEGMELFTEEEQEKVFGLVIKMHTGYFAGKVEAPEEVRKSEAYKLLGRLPDELTVKSYIEGLLSSQRTDSTYLKIQ